MLGPVLLTDGQATWADRPTGRAPILSALRTARSRTSSHARSGSTLGRLRQVGAGSAVCVPTSGSARER